jgi:Flp pilus assembly pilin Flp
MAGDDHRPAHHRLRDERGAALVEFAICATLFLGLIYGSISYGVVFWVKHTLTSAASEGARAAVWAPRNADCTLVPGADPRCSEINTAKAKAKKIVDDSLGDRGVHVPLEDITATIGACGGSDHDCITVVVPYPYGEHPILPALPPIFSLLPDTLSSTSVIELSSS